MPIQALLDEIVWSRTEIHQDFVRTILSSEKYTLTAIQREKLNTVYVIQAELLASPDVIAVRAEASKAAQERADSYRRVQTARYSRKCESRDMDNIAREMFKQVLTTQEKKER